MTSQIKGPAIFLAQFAGDAEPFNSLRAITRWAAGLGYKGVQIPDGATIGYDLEADRARFTVTANGVIVVPKEMPMARQVSTIWPSDWTVFRRRTALAIGTLRTR